MPRMIDLLRESAVPANLMRAAAHGALSLPAAEMLEVLVYLTGNPLFAEPAKLTLAGWDEASVRAILSDPHAPQEVLDYFSAHANLRTALVPALLENSAVPEARLLELAQTGSRDVLSAMLASPRVGVLPEVLKALLRRPELDDAECAGIAGKLEMAAGSGPGATGEHELEPVLKQYLVEHEAEIMAAKDEAFHLVNSTSEEQAEIAAASEIHADTSSVLAARALGFASRVEVRERVSTVQKIARLNVGARVQLALKGNRDERLILIRDGVRVVADAVLESPKLTDAEVELFASMRNVGENVLRGIAAKRKFFRNYTVKRLLTANSKCPLDIALPLVKELLVTDLKHLSTNKNVADTVRRFAFKMMKEKASKRS